MRLITFPILHNLKLKLCCLRSDVCDCLGLPFFFFFCWHITGFVLCVFARLLFGFWRAALCGKNSWTVGRFTSGHWMWMLIETPVTEKSIPWADEFTLFLTKVWVKIVGKYLMLIVPEQQTHSICFPSSVHWLAEVTHLFTHWLNWFVTPKCILSLAICNLTHTKKDYSMHYMTQPHTLTHTHTQKEVLFDSPERSGNPLKCFVHRQVNFFKTVFTD